ncbi:MAG TPA: cob(I)yrinic acid a,c-diamide adenosyltransferase [Patescibacteria group bacterium]|nr:cob(I)yrinic acid a,c-diamide adenosyltransferase [Patescibacteria group bacterium]
MSSKKRGLIYLFTGNGKGKTSAALGIMVRALINGWRVGWVSWYKEERWGISEHHLSKILTKEALERLTFLPMGKGFFLQETSKEPGEVKTVKVQKATIVDTKLPEEHKEAARTALQKAAELLENVDLLILDEVCNAVHDGLLTDKEVVRLLQKITVQHIVLTGRNATSALISSSDLVSDLHKVKHPFDQGNMAVKGLDF